MFYDIRTVDVIVDSVHIILYMSSVDQLHVTSDTKFIHVCLSNMFNPSRMQYECDMFGFDQLCYAFLLNIMALLSDVCFNYILNINVRSNDNIRSTYTINSNFHVRQLRTDFEQR